MTMRADIGTARLAVRIDGDDGLPWLILSNSLGTDHTMWDAQMPALTPHRRVLRYDTRGHGGSDTPPGPYSLDALAGDVVALMDRFGIDRADVMGLSMGGMTAVGLALNHPGRVRRAVCACARTGFPPAALPAWDERVAAVRAGGMAAIIEGTLARWFTPSAPPAALDHARRMMAATDPEGYAACVAAIKGVAYTTRLPDMTVPMHYIAGEHDGAAPPAAMAEMAAATPGAALTVLAGAAHIANVEAAGAFNAAATAFLFG